MRIFSRRVSTSLQRLYWHRSYSLYPATQGSRILVGVYVGTAILVCLVSDRWETGEVHVRSKYKAGTGAEVDAYIGLHIGLKGVNITLKGTPVHQLNETINYNEHFDFSNRQGLNFFGPNANQFNQEYRAAQFRGLPLPILWVAEYFTLDDEWLRWGRHYRESGLYASIALWISLVFWVLANILVFMLLRYNAYMVTLTGLTMCTSVVIKHNFQNPAPLRIPFSAEHVLHMNYGYSFWMCFFTGCFCVLWGLTIFVLDLCWPRSAAAFFSADPLQDEYLLQKEESIPSNDTSVTTVTENSLTSVDIVDEHGNASKKETNTILS
ncbi:dual oxidase maturation factor 1-like isoform X2 [Dreissena polymorpha]|uniref:dual oxidase maturation factor 1-like isoform X2 n=1 Tax=Dreissena polymorpha TaxID=45954 RepID=UPI0022646AD9|nr:dual oxidase maturation factor 1-like isoform X2 [Dreissena polymorpha]